MRIRVNPFDKLFSQYIRKRAMGRVGGCERCLMPKKDIIKEDGSIFPAWKQLQTSHFFGRAKKSVRWDEDNAVALCFGCHQYFTANPYEHTSWFQNHLGIERFEMLAGRARMPGRYIDKSAIAIYLKGKIQEF